MPLYTFICENDHPQEVLCKSSEKDTLEDICNECGRPNKYEGRPELIQSRDYGKGKFRMKAVMGNGHKEPLVNGGRRGDS